MVFEKTDQYTIINDTCFNADKYLENQIDMFFCDPPYFITKGQTEDITNREYWDNQWKTKEEFYEWTKQWMQLMYKWLKDTGSAYICIDWRHSGIFHQLLEEIGFIVRNRITWKREKGRGAKNNWKNVSEDIWFVTKSNDYTFNINDVLEEKEVIAPYVDEEGNPKDWWINEEGKKVRLTHPGNVWCNFTVPFWSSKEVRSYAKTKRTPNNKYQKHPTQKPLELVKKCIKASSNKGDIICDFFLGSGTTMVGALQLERKCIGFDIVKEFCEITKLRIENEVPKINLW